MCFGETCLFCYLHATHIAFVICCQSNAHILIFYRISLKSASLIRLVPWSDLIITGSMLWQHSQRQRPQSVPMRPILVTYPVGGVIRRHIGSVGNCIGRGGVALQWICRKYYHLAKCSPSHYFRNEMSINQQVWNRLG